MEFEEHVYTEPGVYTIVLEAINAMGWVSEKYDIVVEKPVKQEDFLVEFDQLVAHPGFQASLKLTSTLSC